MSEQKDVVRRFHEYTEAAESEKLVPLIAKDFVMYAPGMTDPLPFAQAMQIGNSFLAAFPDARSSLEEQIEEGDVVITRGVYHGTNSGSFMGMPATGRTVAVPWLSLDRLRNGQILEHRFIMDAQIMMQQLGVSTAAAA